MGKIINTGNSCLEIPLGEPGLCSIPARDLVKESRDFAIAAHWGQMYGSKPYYYHLDRVAQLARKYKLPTFVEVAANLHDVVEDTNVTADQVNEEFGYEIATLVYAVTDEDSVYNYDDLIDDGHTKETAKALIRKDKKKNTYPKILAHPYGVHLKLCDRIGNVESSLLSKDKRMTLKYREEAPEFREKLFTPGVASGLWNHLESILQGN